MPAFGRSIHFLSDLNRFGCGENFELSNLFNDSGLKSESSMVTEIYERSPCCSRVAVQAGRVAELRSLLCPKFWWKIFVGKFLSSVMSSEAETAAAAQTEEGLSADRVRFSARDQNFSSKKTRQFLTFLGHFFF